MPIIAVKKLTNGQKLAEDVYTSLGGLLFSKGTPVHEKEKEFLEAFLIDEVSVDENETFVNEKKEEPAKEKESGGTKKKPDAFHQQFDKAISSFKTLMMRVHGGQNIPVMEVREVVSPILQQVQEQPKPIDIPTKPIIFVRCSSVEISDT